MNKTVGIIVGVALLIGGGFVLVGDQNQQQNSDNVAGLAVVTSFYPLQFALERIVGDLGQVTNIGAGRDPHDFRPSTQDVLKLKQADVVVLQGADFEPWGNDLKASLDGDRVPVIVATADIELHEGGHNHGEDEHSEDEHADEHHDEESEHAHEEESHDEHEDEEYEEYHIEATHAELHEDEHEEEHDHGAYDPHTWVDPVLMSEMVEHVAAEIARLDPANAETYLNNAAALQVELEALDIQYKNRLASCALGEVITSHDAFGYLGDRYGFKIHSIAGLSTQDTPSATTLAELRAEAAEGIGAILLEENSITAYGETLARETSLQTLSINPISYVIPAGADYFSLMQDNLDAFAVALNCNE
jgi:zinc transport system substrate-binding protein